MKYQGFLAFPLLNRNGYGLPTDIDFSTFGSAGAGVIQQVINGLEFQVGTTAAPTFSTTPGTYTAGFNLKITPMAGLAQIWYTTDGTDPATVGGTRIAYNPYVGITLFQQTCASTTIRAISYADCCGWSSQVSGTFQTNVTLTNPTVNVTGSPGALTCTITGQEFSNFKYTTDGSDPVANGIVYTTPFSVPNSSTGVKAYAYYAGSTSSGVTTTAVAFQAVTNIVASPSSISNFYGGQNQQITTTVTPTYATNPALAYSSSDSTVAAVSASGLIYCIKGGTATITVTAVDTTNGTITSTVSVTIISLPMYDFASDTIGSAPANITINGTSIPLVVALASTSGFDGSTTELGNIVYANSGGVNQQGGLYDLSLFTPTFADQRIVFRAFQISTQLFTHHGFVLRPQSSFSTAGGATDYSVPFWYTAPKGITVGNVRQGYYFAIDPNGGDVAIYRINATDMTPLVEFAVTTVTYLWYRLTAIGTALKIEGSTNGSTWTSLINTTDSTYATSSGAAIQYINGGTWLAETAAIARVSLIIPVPVTGLTVASTASVAAGATLQLTPVTVPPNANVQGVTYSSGTPGVATVNATTGLVTGVSTGSSIITITSIDTTNGTITTTCTVTVTPGVSVTGVTVLPTSVTLAATQTQQLTPTVAPSNASNKTVSYASNNTSVATVNASTGLITAVAAGSATITVTTTDGSFTATCAVTVSQPVVPDPTIGVNGGTYNNDTTATLSCTDGAASIKYTIDGTDPVSSGTAIVYSTPFTVSATNTGIKFYSYRTGYMHSAVITSNPFTFIVTDPIIDINGGNNAGSVTVHLSTTTSGASIKYTVDGSDPTTGSGIAYSGSVVVSAACNVRFYAYKAGYTNSATIVSGAFTFGVANPTADITTGSYVDGGSVTVHLSTTTAGASIKYTLDGTDPVTNGAVYNGTSLVISAPVTALKFYAYKASYADSSTITAGPYNFACQAPTVDVNGGSYTDGTQTVHLSSLTAGTSIRYTTDGSDPQISGTVQVYSTSLIISVTTVIKFFARKANFLDSSTTTSSAYTFTCATPTIDTNGGVENNPVNVTLSCATSSSAIKYTTDGTDPTISGTAIVYSTTIVVATAETLKFFAYKTGYSNSSVIISNPFSFICASPTIDTNGGTWNDGSVTVHLSEITSGSTVKYTTDGTDPTSSGTATIYSSSIVITGSCTLKYYAYKSGYTPSGVVTSSPFVFTVLDPTIDTNGGVYHDGSVIVHLSDGTSGATIKYTTDGSDPVTDPNTSALTYSTQITISQTTTLKFYALKAGYT